MLPNFKWISEKIIDCAQRGCSNFSFCNDYEPEYIDNVTRYYMEKGYGLKISPINNTNKVLINISWER